MIINLLTKQMIYINKTKLEEHMWLSFEIRRENQLGQLLIGEEGLLTAILENCK